MEGVGTVPNGHALYEYQGGAAPCQEESPSVPCPPKTTGDNRSADLTGSFTPAFSTACSVRNCVPLGLSFIKQPAMKVSFTVFQIRKHLLISAKVQTGKIETKL